MSQTVSRGLVDASHWTGMASAVASYLEAWLADQVKSRQLPKGQFQAASRFFRYVTQGVALDRGEILDPNVPTMAGISNLTIATEVLSALPKADLAESAAVQAMVERYQKCLRAIQKGGPIPEIDRSTVQELHDFLRELQRQGNRARRNTRAIAESPQR